MGSKIFCKKIASGVILAAAVVGVAGYCKWLDMIWFFKRTVILFFRKLISGGKISAKAEELNSPAKSGRKRLLITEIRPELLNLPEER